MKNLKALIIILSLVLTPLFSTAQLGLFSKNKVDKIEMIDGSIYLGEIVKETDEEIVFKTKTTTLKLNKSDCKSIKSKTEQYSEKRAIHNSKYFHDNSAIPLKAGQGYYQNNFITYQRANIGLTNNLSISAGIDFLSLIAETPIYNIYPKFNFQVFKNVHLGIGLNGTNIDGIKFLAGTGTITIGNEKSNFSVTSGYNLFTPDKSLYSNPMIFSPTVVSGILKVRDNISIMTENRFIGRKSDNTFSVWFGDNPMHLGIYGLRWHFRGSAFDLGLATNTVFSDNLDSNFTRFGGPYFSYSYAFSIGENKI